MLFDVLFSHKYIQLLKDSRQAQALQSWNENEFILCLVCDEVGLVVARELCKFVPAKRLISLFDMCTYIDLFELANVEITRVDEGS